MPCEQRERLESALAEMVNRLDYLNKLRRGDPKLCLLKQEIERLSLKIHQAQRKLHEHQYEHGCFVKDPFHCSPSPNAYRLSACWCHGHHDGHAGGWNESRGKVMAHYRIAKAPFIANCNGMPVYIRVGNILLEKSGITPSGMIRFQHDGKACTMMSDDFLNATLDIAVEDSLVAHCGGYELTVKLFDGGWIVGVNGASGAKWDRASDPETGKRLATEMLAKSAGIEVLWELEWKYRRAN
jgi:hypothetical protein